MDYDFMIYD